MNDLSSRLPNPGIFREYDIRGIAEKELVGNTAFLLGKAFAVYLRKSTGKQDLKITVGRDVRLSSAALRDDLVKGLTESGIDVIDIGVCPTPLQYFSVHRLGVDGGIMITGSHNPPEYNGFKLSAGARTIYGDEIRELRSIIEKGDFGSTSRKGKVTGFEIIPEYVKAILPGFSSLEGLRVVVDSGNGTGGLVGPQLMKSLGAEVIELYSEPDGRFPSHHPDPVVLENIRDLQDAVLKNKAHLGIGFDGDSDRIGVVDELGNPVWGDRLMIIFSRDILRESPGAAIIGEVKCSQSLYDDIAGHGGRAIMWKTGHSLIKKKMKEEGALLAGEMSGHIFFADRYFGYDDAIYASLRLLEIVKRAGNPFGIGKLLNGIAESFYTPEIRFDCPDSRKFRIVDEMRTAFGDYPNSTIDGIRINFPEGWALVRASNTQPALVLRFEADSRESLSRIEKLVRGRLEEISGK